LYADEETRGFVRYWFNRTNRRQLAALARAIAEVPKRRVREILWCAFSRLIITKQAGASLALDVAHSRPHKVSDKTVIRPIEQFDAAVRAVVSAIPFRTPHSTPRARIKKADARKLPVEVCIERGVFRACHADELIIRGGRLESINADGRRRMSAGALEHWNSYSSEGLPRLLLGHRPGRARAPHGHGCGPAK
jgi:hypothetical protein